jgi:RNase P subunit RPR2
MIERPPVPEKDDAEEGQAVVVECRDCGHIEYQPLVRSFWRRLAA